MAPLILDKDQAVDSNGYHGHSYTDNHHQPGVQAAAGLMWSRSCLSCWSHLKGQYVFKTGTLLQGVGTQTVFIIPMIDIMVFKDPIISSQGGCNGYSAISFLREIVLLYIVQL